MSTGQTILLGAIAGLTIFLGLPLGRARSIPPSVRTFLNGLSAGILVFLLLDILGQAGAPLEEAASAHHGPRLAALGLVYVLAFGAGLLGLLYWRRLPGRRVSGTSPRDGASLGPGAMAVAEVAVAPQREALRLGMTIAAGIGLHNFSEGLAIGQAANSGAVSLALLLVIGFALHNATEGFGIVGPLAAQGVRAPWRWLLVAGLVGGGPTFVGTLVGTAVTSPYMFVACLALAAGAILYVIGELFAVGRRLGWELTLWGIFAGFLVGLATDLILVAAGV